MILQRVHMFALFAFAFFVSCSIAGAHLSLGLLMICVVIRLIYGERVSGREDESERSRAGESWRLGIEWPVVVFVVVGIIATTFSEKTFESFRNMRHLLTIFGAYGVALSLRWYPQWRRPLLWTFIGSATLFSIFGLWEYAMGISTKVQATQGTTMTWGAMCVIFLAVTLQVALSSPHRRDRWLARVALLPQVFAMLLSLVRGAYVGFFISVIYVLQGYWTNRRILLRRIVPAVLVLILIAALFAPGVYERIALIFDLNYPSTQVRLVQWKYALQIAADHPVVGVGWRDLLEVFRRYVPEDIAVSDHVRHDIFHIGHFHNSYIMYLVCFGVPGLLAFIWLLAAVWRQLRKAGNRAGTVHDRMINSAARAAIAGFLVASFFDWTFGDAEAVTMFWFIAGLGLGQVAPEHANAAAQNDPVPVDEYQQREIATANASSENRLSTTGGR